MLSAWDDIELFSFEDLCDIVSSFGSKDTIRTFPLRYVCITDIEALISAYLFSIFCVQAYRPHHHYSYSIPTKEEQPSSVLSSSSLNLSSSLPDGRHLLDSISVDVFDKGLEDSFFNVFDKGSEGSS